jgi:hypothetical protein
VPGFERNAGSPNAQHLTDELLVRSMALVSNISATNGKKTEGAPRREIRASAEVRRVAQRPAAET